LSEEIKVSVAGACGRMGRELVRAITQSQGLKLVSAFEQKEHPLLGRDAGEVAGVGKLGVEVIDSAEQAISQAQVLVEFTYPEPTLEHLEICAKKETRAVVGTTGFTQEQKQKIEELSKKIPILLAPNMSVGVNLLFSLVEQACRILGEDYDLEIIEAHHRLKKDAPSGTALRLGEILARTRGWDFDKVACYHRQGMVGERPKEQIGIQSIRAGDIVGEHTVIFSTIGERIELTHKASSRQTFARGAVRAVRWLWNQPPGLYSMQDCLGIK